MLQWRSKSLRAANKTWHSHVNKYMHIFKQIPCSWRSIVGTFCKVSQKIMMLYRRFQNMEANGIIASSASLGALNLAV